ncbi:SKI/DACH domain-containing protein 1-like [Mangifera indica]|uniref:SKI/DACH domain-containing protein 1-like n=1 Tax=Mangifera indica TaxID=29780 RepID=UPI001CFB11A7|nr:SKI/DACH domain-containing protein 1-like [Mangifera indica]
MEPSHRCRARSSSSSLPPRHHHHHFHHHHQHHHHHHHHGPLIFLPHHHHLIICPYHHINHHSYHVNATFTPLPPQNSDQPSQNPFKLQAEARLFKHTSHYDAQTWTLQDEENTGLAEEEEEEAEEPIFVLTDEWREFFAASEAKRKLAKKQAKKK